VVGDGGLTSLPDTVEIIIVPDFGRNLARHENPPFDPNKPTFIFFPGGNCITGAQGMSISDEIILSKANVTDFPDGYGPDDFRGDMDEQTYYGCGDMIIVYLSKVAPDYKMAIQTAGVSTGGEPAVDVGMHLNLTYQDGRYAVNRVTLLDASVGCRRAKIYSVSIGAFIASPVDGEQCWLDNYVSKNAAFYPNLLNIGFEQVIHELAFYWYANSLTDIELTRFNNGVVAGGYWSVFGPGKNLQLASTSETQTYMFIWYGDSNSGYMDFWDEPSCPARLPEPVTLLAYSDALDPNDEPTGALLTCRESENAVGYQLLFGPAPYRVMDYDIISDTTIPPTEIITTFPFEETWWTVRAYDQHGSTIYADPILVALENLPPLTIDNLTNGKRYARIQIAIHDANSGDEIVVGPGIYQENIDFRGKNLTLRSTDPMTRPSWRLLLLTAIIRVRW